MPQVASWDYPNRRYYLAFDTVANGIDFAAAYLEERAYRAASGEDIRGQRPMLRGDGRLPKTADRFTPQFVTHLEGARPVPYDTSHVLTLLVEPISDDGTAAGIGIVDRAPLSPSVEVDVEIGYEQVEIITVATGGALTATQDTRLLELWQALESAGVFSTAALANAPAGGGGGDATAANQTTIINAINALPTLTEMENSSALTATADLTGITANIGLILGHTRPMAKQLGLVPGVSATHTESAIVVSDGDGSTTITDNGGGSYTVQST